MDETENFAEACKLEFINDVNRHITREGIGALMAWLNTSDFYYAPASTRFHGCYAGGLCRHSLNVYNRLRQINSNFCFDFSEESMAIVALFHDLCKTDFYEKIMKWRKDADNRWEQYETYSVNEQAPFGGHGSKSVYIVQNYLHLTAEEAAAINCHMGFADRPVGDYSIGSCYERYHLAWALHVADEAATYLDES